VDVAVAGHLDGRIGNAGGARKTARAEAKSAKHNRKNDGRKPAAHPRTQSPREGRNPTRPARRQHGALCRIVGNSWGARHNGYPDAKGGAYMTAKMAYLPVAARIRLTYGAPAGEARMYAQDASWLDTAGRLLLLAFFLSVGIRNLQK